MTVEEIRNTCIEASQKYYDYLNQNNKGVFIINLRKLEAVGSDKFKLAIAGKIFDEETIVFKYLPTGVSYSTQEIKIKVYDRDTDTLIVVPNEKTLSLFLRSKIEDWQIISDLKFLVERVRVWYELNGADIALPKIPSTLPPPPFSIFFEDALPSQEQIQALDAIFKKPLTYIWGAPGTGKTQFVLSYAILHYLQQGKKVAIMAPTNHALEQIFRGVIKNTDRAGINRKDILRLGGPSKKFADEFPEVCEIMGLEKQVEELRKQIAIIKQRLGIDQHSEKIASLKKILTNLPNVTSASKFVEKQTSSILEVKTILKNKELEKSTLTKKIANAKLEQQEIRRQKNAFGRQLLSAFFKKRDFNAEINALIDLESELEANLEEVETALKKLNDNIKRLNKKQESFTKERFNLIRSFNHHLDQIEEDWLELDENNLEQVKSAVQAKIVQIEDDRPTYEALNIEAPLSREQLNEKHQKLQNDLERLEAYSSEERLRNVSIIGATLDTYLYRFKEDNLKVAHIFLDEAGYSNMVKTLTLFNQKVPITLLGDHKQLPPVCELSKMDIQNNTDLRPVLVWDQAGIHLEDLFLEENIIPCLHRYMNNIVPAFNVLQKSNLTGTYRFGKSLSRVLEKFVYPEGFSSMLDFETKIVVYHVLNDPNQRSYGRTNEAEALAIFGLIKERYTLNSDVVILAPYNDQVKAIARKLPEFQKENKILTVHKAQGQEWDTVIYSVCDSGNGKRPWFTDSHNQLSNGLNNINTAISRAKKELIIVCNEEEWLGRDGQLIQGIVQAATERLIFQNT